jgi:hypothetical protein
MFILKSNPITDWSEDYTPENGWYSHRCEDCKKSFLGAKDRLICKLCFNKPKKEKIHHLAKRLFAKS